MISRNPGDSFSSGQDRRRTKLTNNNVKNIIILINVKLGYLGIFLQCMQSVEGGISCCSRTAQHGVKGSYIIRLFQQVPNIYLLKELKRDQAKSICGVLLQNGIRNRLFFSGGA